VPNAIIMCFRVTTSFRCNLAGPRQSPMRRERTSRSPRRQDVPMAAFRHQAPGHPFLRMMEKTPTTLRSAEERLGLIGRIHHAGRELA